MRLTGLVSFGLLLAVVPVANGVAAAPLPFQSAYVGPPGGGELADRQMVDFVFDLRTLPDDDLKRAVTTASIYVEQMWTKADVGLSVFHVAAVHVLSETLETVQDFTWDQVAIQKALTTVGARAGGRGATSETRRTDLTTMCDNFAKRQSTARDFDGSGIRPAFLRLVDGKAVMYFSNGALRNMDATTDVAELTRACTRPNVSFFSIGGATFFDPLPRPGNPVGVSLEIVEHQAGSPVTLVGRPDFDYGFATVTVMNVNAFTIKSLTLAALVRPNDPALGNPQIFTSRIDANIPSLNGRPTISARLIDSATLTSLAIKGAKAQLGIVDIEFEGGRHWTYDLKAKGQFELGGPGPIDAPLELSTLSSDQIERVVQSGRIDALSVIDATDVPADDPFALGAHRIREAGLQPPQIDRMLILGTDRTKRVRIVEVDAIVDATGHVRRVRTARSLDDSPGGIDQRALVLVRDTIFIPARFSPLRFNGEFVPVLVRVPVLVYY